MSLTAATQARLDTQLDKLIRFDGVVRTWRDHLTVIDFAYRRESTENGRTWRGLITRADADKEMVERGERGLAFATYWEAPKLIIDSLTHLPLVTITGYDDVTIEPGVQS